MTGDKQFTGRHVAMIFVSAFGVIIAVNLILAFSAVRTFPGLEVKNSYVASQTFDDRKASQKALGWKVSAKAVGGLVILKIENEAGLPVRVKALEAVLGRATHVKDDLAPDFQFDGQAYVAKADVGEGNWNIRIRAEANDGTLFEQRVILRVEG